MENVTLVRWYHNDGEIIRQSEPMCEIETSQASVDVTAPNDGVLRQLAKTGDVIQPGVDIARIDPIQ